MSIVRSLVLLLALAGAAACNSGQGVEEATTISREAFIEAYVALRVGALRTTDEELPLETRDRILAEKGMEEEDLLTFVEVHGRDVQFMRGIWEEVDSILNALRRPEAPRNPEGIS